MDRSEAASVCGLVDCLWRSVQRPNQVCLDLSPDDMVGYLFSVVMRSRGRPCPVGVRTAGDSEGYSARRVVADAGVLGLHGGPSDDGGVPGRRGCLPHVRRQVSRTGGQRLPLCVRPSTGLPSVCLLFADPDHRRRRCVLRLGAHFHSARLPDGHVLERVQLPAQRARHEIWGWCCRRHGPGRDCPPDKHVCSHHGGVQLHASANGLDVSRWALERSPLMGGCHRQRCFQPQTFCDGALIRLVQFCAAVVFVLGPIVCAAHHAKRP